MKKLFLSLALLALGTVQAEGVYVSSWVVGQQPNYPAQYSVVAKPGPTAIVSVCDSAATPVGPVDMWSCPRRWVLQSTVKPTDKIGYCYGAGTVVANCTQGFQLASVIWGGVTPEPPVIEPPVVGNNTINVKWIPPTQNTDNSPVTNLAGYRIEYGRATGGGAFSWYQLIEVPGATVKTYTITALPDGTYQISVKAYTSTGAESDPSATVSVTKGGTTPPACTAPKPANKVNACPPGTTGTWTQTYVAAAYPTCWTATPTSAPAGACVAVPPPTKTLKTAETIGYKLNIGNANKGTYQRVGTFPAPVACTVAAYSDLNGLVRNVISDYRKVVVDAVGSKPPLQVYAKCALQ